MLITVGITPALLKLISFCPVGCPRAHLGRLKMF